MTGSKWRRMAAVLMAAGVAVTCVVSWPSATKAEAYTPKDLEVRVIQHNIEGGFRNARGEDPLKVLEGVRSQIGIFKPQVVMMEEVCGNQFWAFKKAYPTWDVRFARMVSDEKKCFDRTKPGVPQEAGQVIASPYPLANVTRNLLPGGYTDPAANNPKRFKEFRLLCGDVVIPGRKADGLRACVTHLMAAPSVTVLPLETRLKYRKAQVDSIYGLLKGRYDRGQALVLGGDLNMDPGNPNLDRFYALGRNGSATKDGFMNEADQTDQKYFKLKPKGVTCLATRCRSGQWTTDPNPSVAGSIGRKIDYAFISNNVTHKMPVSGMAADRYGSDHHLYRALFNIRY